MKCDIHVEKKSDIQWESGLDVWVHVDNQYMIACGGHESAVQ